MADRQNVIECITQFCFQSSFREGGTISLRSLALSSKIQCNAKQQMKQESDLPAFEHAFFGLDTAFFESLYKYNYTQKQTECPL